jgi:geranylgeranyl reductase family protein
MRYDAIVVGAGPAGSTAARELARAGRSVLLLERERLPRHKPCGGALSPRLLRRLPFALEASLLEDTITRATFTFCAGESVEIGSDRPMGFMVRRDAFDAALCRSAQAAGARLVEGAAAREVTVGRGAVTLATDAGTFTGRILVGADGAAGAVARAVLPSRRRPTLVAVESLAPMPPEHAPRYRGRILVDFGNFPGGYAWAFPKGDHLNLGAMVLREGGMDLKAAFHRFAAGQAGLRSLDLGRVGGALIPGYDGRLQPVAAGPAFLVGDAAGLVDPFLGEGIYYAVRSAQLLANALAEAGEDTAAAAARYRQFLAEEIEPDFVAALCLSRLIHRFPRLWYRVLCIYDRFLEAYCHVLRGDSTYRELLQRIQHRAATYLGPGLAERLVPGVALAR